MAGGVRTLLVKWVTDTKDIEKGSKKATGALSKIGTVAAGVFTADAAEQAGKAVFDFGKKSVAAAQDDQKSQAILAQTLKNTTRARGPEIESVEKYIGKLGDATGVARDELRPAFASLVRSTHSVGGAQKLMGTAMNISAGTGKDLSLVTLALAKANNGNVGALGRMGIKVKGLVPDTAALSRAQAAQQKALVALNEAIHKHGANSDQAKKAEEKYAEASKKVIAAHSKTKNSTMSMTQVLKSLNQTYGGDAAKAADTSAGKMARLNERWHEMQVDIGTKLLPILTTLMDWLLNKLPTAISGFVAWVGKEWPKVWQYISPLVAFLKVTYQNVKQIIQGVILVFQGLIQFVRAVFTGQWGKAWEGIQKMFSGFWKIIKGYVSQAWQEILVLFRVGLTRLGPILVAGLDALGHFVWNGISAIMGYWVQLPGKLAGVLWQAVASLPSIAATLGTYIGIAIYNGVKNALSGLADLLSGIVKGAINAIIRVWNNISIPIHIPSVGIGPFKTPGIDVSDLIPNIPLLASGGITRGSGLAYLHPLEAVVPLNGNGGLGSTYNITVNVPPMANPAAVGAATVSAIKAYERRNGASWRN